MWFACLLVVTRENLQATGFAHDIWEFAFLVSVTCGTEKVANHIQRS
jgi:hypothetical protein